MLESGGQYVDDLELGKEVLQVLWAKERLLTHHLVVTGGESVLAGKLFDVEVEFRLESIVEVQSF